MTDSTAQLRPWNLWSETALCTARIETTWNAKGDDEGEREGKEKKDLWMRIRRTRVSRMWKGPFPCRCPSDAFSGTNDPLRPSLLRNPRSPRDTREQLSGQINRGYRPGQPKPSRNSHRRTRHYFSRSSPPSSPSS